MYFVDNSFMIGKRYNNIIVKSETDKHNLFVCQCLICGKEFLKTKDNIKANKNASCGCLSSSGNLVGKKFGKLLVVKLNRVTPHNEREWECLCDCGNISYKTSNQLTKGYATQCRNCGMKEISKKNSKPKKYSKRLFECWVNMKTRTTNKKQDKFNRYINRNINICDEWKNDYYSFEKWALENGYKENLTIDRINNDGYYEPSNCRWVDRTAQANNRRTNVFLEYKGIKKTMAQWSKELNIPYSTIQYKKNKGYDLERIIYEFNNSTRLKRKNR